MMVVRMVMIVTVVIVTVVIVTVVVVMSSMWSSNNGDSTDNCGSKGTRLYWYSQVYMDYVSWSQFRVLFRRKKRFERYFNRSIRTCRITGQSSEQDVNTWSLFAFIIVFVVVCFSLSLCHRPKPAGVDETGGQQDISLYEIQDSSVQGSTTVYLKFPPFAFHLYAVTCP